MAGQTVEVSLGDPGPSATFQIPADIVPFVDSVYAEIDNSAGGDTTPTLEIRGPNGDTVAAVPQDDVIPGGDTGRATWALRLPGKRRRGGTTSAAVIYSRGVTDNPSRGDSVIVVPAGGSIYAPFSHIDPADSTGVISWSATNNPNDTADLQGPGLFMVQTSVHFQTAGVGEVAFPLASDEWPTMSWGTRALLDSPPFGQDPLGVPTNLAYSLIHVPASSSISVKLWLQQNTVANINVTQAYMSIIGYPGV